MSKEDTEMTVGRTATAEEFETAYRTKGPAPCAETLRVKQLAVGECCAFPCDGSDHVSRKPKGHNCHLAVRLSANARFHGRKIKTVHFNGELLVRRVS